MKHVKCALCSKLFRYDGNTPVVTVDGHEHHHCPKCMTRQREEFIAKLVSGDKRANEIWDIVTTAVKMGSKKGRVQ